MLHALAEYGCLVGVVVEPVEIRSHIYRSPDSNEALLGNHLVVLPTYCISVFVIVVVHTCVCVFVCVCLYVNSYIHTASTSSCDSEP